MTSAFRFGAALTPLDRQYVWFGRHPCANVNVGLLTIFDGQVEPDRIFNAFDRNVQRVPRLRERLAWPPGGLRTPRWVAAGDYALRRHTTVRPDASVADIVDDRLSSPLPMDRPLWHYSVGCHPDGRSVGLWCHHHALADGSTTAAIFSGGATAVSDSGAGSPPLIERATASLRAFGCALAAVGAAARTRASRQALGAEVRLVTHPPERHAALSRRRHHAGFVVGGGAWNEEARSSGGGANDLLVWLAARLAHRCHLGRDETVQVAMPVNNRSNDTGGGNRFGVAILTISDELVGDDRLEDLRGLVSAAKEDPDSPAGPLTRLIGTLPGTVAARLLLRLYSHTDMMATHLALPPPPLSARRKTMFVVPNTLGNAVSVALLRAGELATVCVAVDGGAADPAAVHSAAERLLADRFGDRVVRAF